MGSHFVSNQHYLLLTYVFFVSWVYSCLSFWLTPNLNLLTLTFIALHICISLHSCLFFPSRLAILEILQSSLTPDYIHPWLLCSLLLYPCLSQFFSSWQWLQSSLFMSLHSRLLFCFFLMYILLSSLMTWLHSVSLHMHLDLFTWWFSPTSSMHSEFPKILKHQSEKVCHHCESMVTGEIRQNKHMVMREIHY